MEQNNVIPFPSSRTRTAISDGPDEKDIRVPAPVSSIGVTSRELVETLLHEIDGATGDLSSVAGENSEPFEGKYLKLNVEEIPRLSHDEDIAGLMLNLDNMLHRISDDIGDASTKVLVNRMTDLITEVAGYAFAEGMAYQALPDDNEL